KTVGPQTRAFCSDYASAVSDESMADEASVVRGDLKIAQATLAGLRAQRAERRVVVSSDQPQVHLAAHFIPAASPEQALAAARQVDAMVLPSLVQIMLFFGGICLANEMYRHRARIPWVDVDKWLRRAALTREVVTGRRGLPAYVPPADGVHPR